MDKTTILNMRSDPEALEGHYRQQPEQFRQALQQACVDQPDDMVLRTWQARLLYKDKPVVNDESIERFYPLILTIVLSFVATALIKFGNVEDLKNQNWFQQRFTIPIIITAIIIYYLTQYRPERKAGLTIIASVVVCYLYSFFLPDIKQADTSLLAVLYMPFILWSAVFLSYAGKHWQSAELRMNFIRYTGELAVTSAAILLGGVVLVMLSMALFKLIGVKAETFLFEYVVVWGLVSCTIVATYVIDKVMENQYRLSAVLAKVFAPIFLIMVVVYLVMMLIEQKSPYSDRNFLLTFNVLLLIVLAIATFSISEFSKQKSSQLMNYINVALISATLVINVIALSAIIYRLSSFGITPNRFAVLGTNLIIFINLIGILHKYIPVLKGQVDYSCIEVWCARYLPIYTGWSIFVALLMPLLFWFK